MGTAFTGDYLLKALLIRGKLALESEERLSNEEIQEALTRCSWLIRTSFAESENVRNFSPRQFRCAWVAIRLAVEEKYEEALRKLEDCIEDSGKGKNREVTTNEMVLYMCVITCFLAKLNENKTKE